MIIARCTNGELLIGLSARNVEALMQGKPIHRTDSVIAPGLIIMYGATEQAIIEELAKNDMVAPDAVVQALKP